MFNVFKETWVGLRDLNYGSQIMKFSWKKVFKHWFSAFVWVFVVWTLGTIAFWTYFVPQIPKMIIDKIPDIQVELKQKKLYVIPATPLVLGDSQNILAFEPEFILLKNNGKVTKIDYPDQNFSLNKTLVLAFVKESKIKIWLAGIALISIFLLVITLSLSISQMTGLLLWSVVFWVGGKLLLKKLSYLDTLKICIYASVPGIFISIFGNSGMLGTILPLVLFAWYSGMWIYKLPSSK